MPFDEHSAQLRHHVVSVWIPTGPEKQLAQSGGWLGEVTILFSDLLGLWDIFALMTIFVIAWILIRTVAPVVSMPLGLMFDLSIPMQYQNPISLTTDHDSTRSMHEQHLAGYWPVFLIGTAMEIVGFVMLLPDMFTLVVCVKTTICLTLWLTHQADGTRVNMSDTPQRSSSPRQQHQAAPGRPQPSSGHKQAPPSAHQQRATQQRIPQDPSSVDQVLGIIRQNVEQVYPGLDAKLQAAGYDALTREGMRSALSSVKDKKKADELVKSWTTGDYKDKLVLAHRTKQYQQEAYEARQAIEMLLRQAGGSHPPPRPVQPPAQPKSPSPQRQNPPPPRKPKPPSPPKPKQPSPPKPKPPSPQRERTPLRRDPKPPSPEKSPPQPQGRAFNHKPTSSQPRGQSPQQHPRSAGKKEVEVFEYDPENPTAGPHAPPASSAKPLKSAMKKPR